MKRTKWLAAALALASGAIWAQSSMARPEIFSDLTLDNAKSKAKEEHKLLIVDFTAKWCGPCQMMDRTTWNDTSVENWLKDNAIAVQIDVDEQKDVAGSLDVHAMPTLLVFKPKGKGVAARQLGYQRPEELLGWLKHIKGKTQKS